MELDANRSVCHAFAAIVIVLATSCVHPAPTKEFDAAIVDELVLANQFDSSTQHLRLEQDRITEQSAVVSCAGQRSDHLDKISELAARRGFQQSFDGGDGRYCRVWARSLDRAAFVAAYPDEARSLPSGAQYVRDIFRACVDVLPYDVDCYAYYRGAAVRLAQPRQGQLYTRIEGDLSNALGRECVGLSGDALASYSP